jgi:hypothetical protein
MGVDPQQPFGGALQQGPRLFPESGESHQVWPSVWNEAEEWVITVFQFLVQLVFLH